MVLEWVEPVPGFEKLLMRHETELNVGLERL